tara:strand:- start:3756 stop:4325 length:570 start_codon:yes stop_codon:yes gene_type:complete
MGMFDDIIVPKSYLKAILDKKDESLFETYHRFQTKDLENNFYFYKIYRNQLYKQVPTKAEPKWDKTTTTAEINFYSNITTGAGDECWFEFQFKFVNGKLDSKKLIDKSITNKESREAIDRMWDMEQAVFEEYRQKWSYKFWTRVEHFCQKLTVMARNRHSIPYSLRETAYKTSGRLKKDPDCLKLYIDN